MILFAELKATVFKQIRDSPGHSQIEASEPHRCRLPVHSVRTDSEGRLTCPRCESEQMYTTGGEVEMPSATVGWCDDQVRAIDHVDLTTDVIRMDLKTFIRCYGCGRLFAMRVFDERLGSISLSIIEITYAEREFFE